MEIIDMIKSDNKSAKWIVDQFNKELLYVDDSFQRRYVWLEKHQIKLVETILLGYAIPEIYLWSTSTDPNTGDTKYSIVDGQQRIGALVAFINGDFKLRKTQLENANAPYADRKFSELEDEDKNKIWKYHFTFRVIMSDVSRENIVKLFLRLNSTDKSLNPQELRNAEFDGEFLKTANIIAEFPFWENNKIFSIDALRRMKDIEFISSILIFLRMGIESEITQKAINKAYDLFNENYEQADEDVGVFEKMLQEIQKLIDYDKKVLEYVKKNTHLYTLLVVAYKSLIVNDGFEESNINNLIQFFAQYNNSERQELIEYKNLILEGTTGKANRMRRVEILSDVADL